MQHGAEIGAHTELAPRSWIVSSDGCTQRSLSEFGGDGVISRESAAAVHGLGDVDPLRIHLSVPASLGRASEVVVLHRAELDPVDVEHRLG